MRKAAVVVGLVIAAGFLGSGWLGLGPFAQLFHHGTNLTAHGGIQRLQLVPIPEGPISSAFERMPASSESRSLSLLRSYIPDPLPAPVYQGPTCHLGGNLVITFDDGFRLTYGPCRRPRSINRLWAAVIYVLDNGACAPRCGPGGAPGP